MKTSGRQPEGAPPVSRARAYVYLPQALPPDGPPWPWPCNSSSETEKKRFEHSYHEHQRTGAGSAAIRAALGAAEQAGENFVIVLGHPSYYPRFGFTRASEYGIRPSIDVPDEALMALSLDSVRLPSGTVRYAAPFGI